GERAEDVLHMVRQDRQELRGWQEPAHVRAVVRRTIHEGGSEGGSSERGGIAELEFCRTAAEPERGQQREATGQLLEAGLSGLEKALGNNSTDLSSEQVLGLECILLLYGRPALLVSDNQLASVPPYWNLLEDQRE